MNDQQPTPAPQGPVEYLGGVEPAERSRRTRGRSGLVAGGAAAVVALGAAGAWGVTSFMSGGQEAAAVVPAEALAYVSLNLDPDGGQKLEAYQTLKKFPALEEYLDASSGGEDLRRALVEPLLAQVDCPGVTFEDDVAPWLGNVLAVAAVPGGGSVEPVGFLQVTDEDAAADGIATLAECSPEDDADDLGGTAFTDGWLVVAETDAKAQAAVAAAADGALEDDADYQRWVEEAGGAGIVTAYVDAEAPASIVEAVDGNLGMLDDSGAGGRAEAEQVETIKDYFADFEGGAAVLRFADESLEVQTAFGGLPAWTASEGDNGVAELPETTAVAYGMAVSDTFVQDLLDAYSSGAGEDEVDQFLAEGEQLTGLSLPEDLQAVLGDGIAVALDGSADFGSDMSSPASVPVGLRITGDPSDITPALDKVLGALAGAGLPAGLVSVEEGDGAVGVALTPDRATALAADGSLGDKAAFTEALPDLDESGAGLYVGLDDGAWFDSLLAQAQDDKVEANVAPLHSLGITSWTEGGTAHGLVKLTTE